MDYYWFVLYAAVNGLIVTLLALNVSVQRMSLGVANGDGGKLELKKAIRAHGNGVEHTAIFGLVVLALALVQALPAVQGFVVIVFSIARLLHGFSMIASAFNVRRAAAGLTYSAELFAIGALIFHIVV